MMIRNYPLPLRAAIAEIATDNAHTYPESEITAADAASHADDDDVLNAWWNWARAMKRDVDAATVIYAELSEAQRAQFLCATICGHPSALRLMRDAMVAHVAQWLATAATEYQNNLEPTDRDLARSYAAEVDCQVRRDRRALARAATAASRTGREPYFDV